MLLFAVIRAKIHEGARGPSFGEEQVPGATGAYHVPVSLHHPHKDETQRFAGILT